MDGWKKDGWKLYDGRRNEKEWMEEKWRRMDGLKKLKVHFAF